MTGWCPNKTGSLEESECHFDGYCEDCPHNKESEEKMSEKLKPCPFCGRTPQTVVDDATEEKFGVKCFFCGGMIDAEKETLQEAIEAWDRRAKDE